MADQQGIALVMALGFMLVLLVVGSSLAYYATTNLRSTSHSSAKQRAFTIAEAGLNAAASILENPSNDPTNPALLPSSSSPSSLTMDSGTASWWGSYDATAQTWTVTAKGTVRNPTATPPITRTVTKQFLLTSATTWKYVYMDNAAGCLTIGNSIQISEPLFVKGSICMSNTAQITAAASQVWVAGTITTANSASVGTSAAPLPQLHVTGGCRYSSGSYVTPCTSAQQVYATSQDTTVDTSVTKPPIDLATWYANAQPGPNHACTTGSFPGGFDNDTTRNNSLGSVNLMPSTAYSCTVTSGGSTVGRIAWTPGSPGTLSIAGTIYFDGNLNLSGTTAGVYSGRGTIYASGTVSFGNSEQLCGAYVSGHCDWTSWQPNTNMLILVAGSSTAPDFTINQSSMFQGGAYAVTDFVSGQSVGQQGPIVANNITLGNSSQAGFPQLTTVPAGAPGGVTITAVSGSWRG